MTKEDAEKMETVQIEEKDEAKPQKVLGGSLLYVTKTRSDIKTALRICLTNKPSKYTTQGLKNVIRYLREPFEQVFDPKVSKSQTPTLNDVKNTGSVFHIENYSDSDFAKSKSDRKSITGAVTFYNNCLVNPDTKKQGLVASSPTEAEIIGQAKGIKDAKVIQNLAEDLELPLENRSGSPITQNTDSESCQKYANAGEITKRSKHIDLRVAGQRDDIASKRVSSNWCPRAKNVGDMFTHPLPFPDFSKFRKQLGLRPLEKLVETTK